ncbi:P34 probable thiol protease-like [Prosopis cineraria]|uniref:P34 probable thiol protease-like n=1 Tax=Prosopis cineraria TaxID=364024 RepID=UPI00240FCE1A|nr:P34 probable thiol protease-like [Prosopis cineraria]
MASEITKLIFLFFLWYSLICLASSVPDDYFILNQDLDKFNSEKEVLQLFKVWKQKSEREHQNLQEETRRFQTFQNNLKHIRQRNAERKLSSDYSLGLNKFSDVSYEEFSKIYLHETSEPIIESNMVGKMVSNNESCPNAPSSLDWRLSGAEGSTMAHFNMSLKMVVLPQKETPYSANNSGCNSTLEQKKFATIDGYNYCWQTPISENSLFCSVAKQPISVSFYANQDFMSYKSGIFVGANCSSIGSSTHNHAVLIVGYGSLGAGQDYWIVKNSWGASWGQRGYIFIKRNTDSTQGVCDINYAGAYPTKQTNTTFKG